MYIPLLCFERLILVEVVGAEEEEEEEDDDVDDETVDATFEMLLEDSIDGGGIIAWFDVKVVNEPICSSCDRLQLLLPIKLLCVIDDVDVDEITEEYDVDENDDDDDDDDDRDDEGGGDKFGQSVLVLSMLIDG